MIWRRRRALEDLDEDIREHLARETEENLARGLSPEEAHAAARRAFGSVTRVKEDTRAVWIPIWADQLAQDVRYAFRLVRHSPGFSCLVIATLALGIGLTTAVFSVVNAVLLRPLAYRDGDRLVWIVTYDDRVAPIKSIEAVAAPDFMAFQSQSSTLDRVVAFDTSMERVTAKDGVVATRVAMVSSDFWDLAGATPALGRLPGSGEDAIAAVARVLRKRLQWRRRRRRTHGDCQRSTGTDRRGPAANISSATAGAGRRFAIAARRGRGVPRDDHPAACPDRPRRPDVLRDRAHEAWRERRAGERRTRDVARRRAARLSKARVSASTASDAVHRRARRTGTALAVDSVRLRARRPDDRVREHREPAARPRAARRKEVAVRAAIGAGRGRVLRQFLVENLLVASVGGIAGLLVARAAVSSMIRLLPYAIPRLTETTIDGRVLTFASLASILTAFVCGIAPAAALWRMNVQDALKDGTRMATASPRALRARGALVTIELALASVLVVAAILLVKSLWRITAYPPGFDPEHVLTLKVQMSGQAYRAPDKKAHVSRRGAAAGASGAGRAGRGRRVGRGRANPFCPTGRSSHVNARSSDRPAERHVGGYPAAVGMKIVDGRWMTDDEPSAVYVINEALARRYFIGENPIGRSLLLPNGPDPARAIPVPIVGIVADLHTADLESTIEPALFLDYRHGNPFAMTVNVRTKGDPLQVAPTLRAKLAAIDPTQALFEMKRLDTALMDSIAPRRMTLTLLAVFAGSALLLGVIGIYGVMAYSVAQRTQEIGVRMALGATRRAVLMMVMRQGLGLTAAGVALGAVSAVGMTRMLTSLLYEVQPTDVSSFAVAFAGIVATAIAACGVPAMTASLVDPVTALRCD